MSPLITIALLKFVDVWLILILFYAGLFPKTPLRSPRSILIILHDIFVGGRRAVDPVATV